jgi:hypothetical protein
MKNSENRYKVVVNCCLDASWSEWFGEWAINQGGDGNSVLTSPPIDQAALCGVLTKMVDLNMPLISVNRLDGET